MERPQLTCRLTVLIHAVNFTAVLFYTINRRGKGTEDREEHFGFCSSFICATILCCRNVLAHAGLHSLDDTAFTVNKVHSEQKYRFFLRYDHRLLCYSYLMPNFVLTSLQPLKWGPKVRYLGPKVNLKTDQAVWLSICVSTLMFFAIGIIICAQ